MKILSALQLREWDAYTIANEPISSVDLMERAALACADWITARFPANRKLVVFCGNGNNGGDGLAIARLMTDRSYSVTVYVLDGEKQSEDFKHNLERLPQTHLSLHPLNGSLPDIDNDSILIDALLGSGLNRPVTGFAASLIKHMNQSGAVIISIDIPSGMPVDKSCKGDAVIRANHTLTFQVTKHCFLMAENAGFFGELSILDIKLDKNYPGTTETALSTVSHKEVAERLHTRSAFSHKGTYGHAWLVAGSKGKIGAAILAARACLRSGTGLLTISIPEAFSSIIHTTIPEAMITAREEAMDETSKYAAIGIGPGAGVDEPTASLLQNLLHSFTKPMVIDADALTILSQHKDWLALIPAGSLLTPHPREFDRLFGNSGSDFDREEKALTLSKKYPFVIVLKGHYTLIAADGKGWYNTTGNAGLAKGGSGDILTGILTTLLAQQYSPADAAVLGVYLHGLSADITLQYQSMESMLATDIIENLGQAFQSLRQ